MRKPAFVLGLTTFVLVSSTEASPCLKPSQKTPEMVTEISKRGGDPTKYVYQEFPGPRGNETAWLVGYAHEPGRSMFIREAYFRPGPNKSYVKILGVSGLAEIYVPYVRRGALRIRNKFWDIRGPRGTGYGPLNTISDDEKGGCGDLLEPVVGREVRERGFLWREGPTGRRGYELVIWASQNAINYDYVILYQFSDDGTVHFRFGPTSRNLPRNEKLVHVHTAIWRLNVDLDGGLSTVHAMKYVEHDGEPEPKAEVKMELFNNGKEGSLDWDPRSFTAVMVHSDTLRNGNGKHSSMHVSAQFAGIARHVGGIEPGESFSLGTYWATVRRETEFRPQQLATYANGESIRSTRSTIWVQTPLLHVPRDEDGRCLAAPTEVGCSGGWEGVALVHLGGVDIMPKNLFDSTPFYK